MYFKRQHEVTIRNDADEEVCREFTEKEPGTFDYLISDKEFDAATSKLKTNKGVDNILNEVLKFGKDPMKGHSIKLFNRILNSGVYPSLWTFG